MSEGSGFEWEHLPGDDAVLHAWGDLNSEEVSRGIDEAFAEYHQIIDKAAEAVKEGDMLTFLGILDCLQRSLVVTIRYNAAIMVQRAEELRRQAGLN